MDDKICVGSQCDQQTHAIMHEHSVRYVHCIRAEIGNKNHLMQMPNNFGIGEKIGDDRKLSYSRIPRGGAAFKF